MLIPFDLERHNQISRGLVPIEKITPVLGPVVGGTTFIDRGARVGKHHHDHGQFVYVVSGTMVVMTEGAFWLVPAQRGLWIPAMTDHDFHMTTAVEIQTIYVLDREDLSHQSSHCRVLQVSPLLREIVDRITRFDKHFSRDSPEGRLAQVLLDEIRMAPVNRLTAIFPRDPRLQKMAAAIAADPGDATPLSEWAGHLGASERTIARLFQKETGMSFVQWRQQIRLFGALQQLSEGKTVTEIALNFGYNSTSAFISLFKKHLGTTPSRYFRP